MSFKFVLVNEQGAAGHQGRLCTLYVPYTSLGSAIHIMVPGKETGL